MSLIMIIEVLIVSFHLPINVAHASVQNISITKLIDEPYYKETFFVITANEKTYHILVAANITIAGNEILVGLTAATVNPHNATITVSAAVPDTLTDHPYVDEVEAIHFHIQEKHVEDLVYLVLPVAMVITIVIQIYLILEDISTYSLGILLNQATFVWASIPDVLLTLLMNDSNDDDTGTHTSSPYLEDRYHLGSFDMYIPYKPVSYHFSLVLDDRYYIATSKSWWEIEKHMDCCWIICWDYFTINWIYSRESELPEREMSPHASFEWNPIEPIVGEKVNFTSTSFDPDGVIAIFHWWFGEGNESTGQSLAHVYTNTGDYNVTLEVTDNDGHTDNTTRTLSVLSETEATLQVIPHLMHVNVAATHSAAAKLTIIESLNQTDLKQVTFQSSDFKNFEGNIIPSENVAFDRNEITIPKGNYTIVTATFYTPENLLIETLRDSWYNGSITVSSENGGNATVFVELVVSAYALHDVAVIDVTPAVDWLYQGRLYPSNINVTVANEGDAPDTFNVTVYADSNTTNILDEYIIGLQKITLVNGTSTVLSFPWNTTPIIPCHNYTITAVANMVANETDLADNIERARNMITITFATDLNKDGTVNIQDLFTVAKAFDSHGPDMPNPDDPPSEKWNETADVNEDDWVNIKDLFQVAKDYGKKLGD